MNKKALTIWGVVALAVIGFLIYSNNRKDKKIKELKDSLNSNNLISEKIKEQLLKLIETHPHIDVDVKNELEQIAILIGVQQESKAILGLAKIIENLLKKLLKSDPKFKEFLKTRHKKRGTFADHLDFANECGIINKEDFHLISVLKLIRNEEAHELNVIKDKAKLVGCFISGVSIAITLYNLIKLALPKEINKESK